MHHWYLYYAPLVSFATCKRILAEDARARAVDLSWNFSDMQDSGHEHIEGLTASDFEDTQLDPQSRLPAWVLSLWDRVVAAISLIGSFTSFPEIKTKWIVLGIDRFVLKKVYAWHFVYHGKANEVRLDINDLLLDARVYLKQLRLLKVVPTLLNRLVGDAFVDLKVQGGIRAGFHKQPDGGWAPDCQIDSKGVGVPPKLRVWANLHINKALNWVDVVVPALLPLLKAIVAGEINEALSNFADRHPKVFNALKLQSATVRSWWRGGDSDSGNGNGTIREGEECYKKDNCKPGPCSYCGKGFCCRAGNFAGGCDGSGGEKHHVCVPAPRYRMAHGAENLGEECWNAHSCRNGKCDFCGHGLCCRQGRKRGECDGVVGGIGRHECVVNPSVEIARVAHHVEVDDGENTTWTAHGFDDEEFFDASEDFAFNASELVNVGDSSEHA